MLDFFGAETPWQRRLWDVGSCMTLAEILEATHALAEGALSRESVNNLAGSAQAVVGPDPGIGTRAERSTLTSALQGGLSLGSFDERVVAQLHASASQDYLLRWSVALEVEPTAGAERIARCLAAHMLGLGFSPDYLHRWWTYRLQHEPGERTLSALVHDAHERAQEAASTYWVIAPLVQATARATEMPGWISPDGAGELLSQVTDEHIGGLAGALKLPIVARDPGAAVTRAADLIDRYVARITLGGGGERLETGEHAWVIDGKPRRFALHRRRGLEIPVLLRRDEPITGPVEARIDASLELLGGVDRGPAAAAVAGSWASVETLLSAPGDGTKVKAGDRLAALIACSFPRAELTRLVHRYLEGHATPDAALTDALERASTKTQMAGRLARHLEVNHIHFDDPSDDAATRRLQSIVQARHLGLADIETHLQRAIRRLYRVRNLVLHNAATDSLTLDASLRSTTPLLGAGIDRLVRGELLQGTGPLDLAARARIVIDNADALAAGDLADLLQLADNVEDH